MVAIFISLITIINCLQIIYKFDANEQNQDYWAGNFNFLLCRDHYIFSQSDMSSALIRNFELPPHYRIQVDLIFYRIDSWNSDKFKIYLDNSQIFEQAYSFTTGSQNLCGDSTYDEIIQISVQAQHNSNFAVVYMQAQDVDNDNNESWGIQSFTLSIEPCPYGCDYCESNSYLYCKRWSLQYWDQRQNSYGYYDYHLYQ